MITREDQVSPEHRSNRYETAMGLHYTEDASHYRTAGLKVVIHWMTVTVRRHIMLVNPLSVIQ